jgi:tRNA-specific 2-thiouridylase
MANYKSQKRIVVAISGGIDSSVAAFLLKKAGFDLIGVFMRFWSENDLANFDHRCFSLEAEKRAKKIADLLDIPFYVFKLKREFKKRVIDYFLKEYKEGRTPNPCVVCNKEIKFGLFLKKALKLGADFVASGHYAKICQKNKDYKLLRAKDKKKDQSYFLWQLSQQQLKRILFPLANLTKNQVKNLAKKYKLPSLNVPESQEICFVKTSVNDFLKENLKLKPGKILNIEGKIIGQHEGLALYTIGQRKGIEISGGPYYVVKKDLKNNNLIVTPYFADKNLYQKRIVAKKVNWILKKEPKLPLKIEAQIRYNQKPVLAKITKKLKPKEYEIVFKKSQRAVTPGQSVVFYQKNLCLGGGEIATPNNF